MTKCDRGGGGSKLAKNSVTYFMDDPKDVQQGRSAVRKCIMVKVGESPKILEMG